MINEVQGAGESPSAGAESVQDVFGAVLYLEDGTYAVTDELGYFHFEGVQPGVHVVQLDMDTLPSQYEPVPHTQNTRFSGRSFSQFVDLQGGTLWRTDFRVALRAPPKAANIGR